MEAISEWGWFQVDRAMRPVSVVVVDVDAQDTLKLVGFENSVALSDVRICSGIELMNPTGC